MVYPNYVRYGFFVSLSFLTVVAKLKSNDESATQPFRILFAIETGSDVSAQNSQHIIAFIDAASFWIQDPNLSRILDFGIVTYDYSGPKLVKYFNESEPYGGGVWRDAIAKQLPVHEDALFFESIISGEVVDFVTKVMDGEINFLVFITSDPTEYLKPLFHSLDHERITRTFAIKMRSKEELLPDTANVDDCFAVDSCVLLSEMTSQMIANRFFDEKILLEMMHNLPKDLSGYKDVFKRPIARQRDEADSFRRIRHLDSAKNSGKEPLDMLEKTEAKSSNASSKNILTTVLKSIMNSKILASVKTGDHKHETTPAEDGNPSSATPEPAVITDIFFLTTPFQPRTTLSPDEDATQVAIRLSKPPNTTYDVILDTNFVHHVPELSSLHYTPAPSQLELTTIATTDTAAKDSAISNSDSEISTDFWKGINWNKTVTHSMPVNKSLKFYSDESNNDWQLTTEMMLSASDEDARESDSEEQNTKDTAPPHIKTETSSGSEDEESLSLGMRESDEEELLLRSSGTASLMAATEREVKLQKLNKTQMPAKEIPQNDQAKTVSTRARVSNISDQTSNETSMGSNMLIGWIKSLLKTQDQFLSLLNETADMTDTKTTNPTTTTTTTTTATTTKPTTTSANMEELLQSNFMIPEAPMLASTEEPKGAEHEVSYAPKKPTSQHGVEDKINRFFQVPTLEPQVHSIHEDKMNKNLDQMESMSSSKEYESLKTSDSFQANNMGKDNEEAPELPFNPTLYRPGHGDNHVRLETNTDKNLVPQSHAEMSYEHDEEEKSKSEKLSSQLQTSYPPGELAQNTINSYPEQKSPGSEETPSNLEIPNSLSTLDEYELAESQFKYVIIFMGLLLLVPLLISALWYICHYDGRGDYKPILQIESVGSPKAPMYVKACNGRMSADERTPVDTMVSYSKRTMTTHVV